MQVQYELVPANTFFHQNLRWHLNKAGFARFPVDGRECKRFNLYKVSLVTIGSQNTPLKEAGTDRRWGPL